MPGATPTMSVIPPPATDAQYLFLLPFASSHYLYAANYSSDNYGIIYANLSSGEVREIPGILMAPLEASDGSMWGVFPGTEYGGAQLRIYKAVYLTEWSLWPGTSLPLGGTPQYGTEFGIMESPSVNSGPFTETSQTPSICTVGQQSGHNFEIYPTANAGTCTVVVADAHGVTQTITATSNPLSGTIQARPGRFGRPQPWRTTP